MATADENVNPEKNVSPTLAELQRVLGEVISVTSLELLDDSWLVGDQQGRANKKHTLLLKAMQLTSKLEKELE
jgi:hypothetical protein